MAASLEVHVFGAKIGESIAIVLPGGAWGVVDTYTPTLSHPESNPVVRFLAERGVTHLAFVCLTHPHEDHYRGMSYFLETYKPDHVWIFGSSTHKNLFAKVAEILTTEAESKHLDSGNSENAAELVRILDRIQADHADTNRSPRLKVCRLQLEMPLLDLPGTPSVRITAIGASGGRALEYENSLVRCFTLDGQCLVNELPRVDHNMISGGLLIEYGKARIILGGDIDTKAWEETLRTLQSDRLRSDLIKVSHHGSATGYCAGLWQQFSPEKSAIAVITPYSKQGLPSADGLEHITRHARSILTPSVKAAALATNWNDETLDTRFAGISADVLVTLRALFPKAKRPSDRLEGVCSFVVAPDGSISHTHVGEAGRLC